MSGTSKAVRREYSSNEGAKVTVAMTKNKFSDKCKMTVDRSGNRLVLKVEKNISLLSSEDCDVDFEVKVPKTVDLDLAMGSGNLSINDIQGSLAFKTGSGAIDLKFATSPLHGELDLKTGSGDATILFPKGSRVKTSFHAGSGQVSNELGDNPSASFLVSMKAGSGDLKIKSF